MRLLVVVLSCVVGLSQSSLPTGTPSAPFPHDAYIWQRLWTPRVIAAAERSADLVRAWRVRLAEATATGGWVTVTIPWDALEATDRPASATSTRHVRTRSAERAAAAITRGVQARCQI